MRADCTKLMTAAARGPVRKLPANSQLFLPVTTPPAKPGALGCEPLKAARTVPGATFGYVSQPFARDPQHSQASQGDRG